MFSTAIHQLHRNPLPSIPEHGCLGAQAQLQQHLGRASGKRLDQAQHPKSMWATSSGGRNPVVSTALPDSRAAGMEAGTASEVRKGWSAAAAPGKGAGHARVEHWRVLPQSPGVLSIDHRASEGSPYALEASLVIEMRRLGAGIGPCSSLCCMLRCLRAWSRLSCRTAPVPLIRGRRPGHSLACCAPCSPASAAQALCCRASILILHHACTTGQAVDVNPVASLATGLDSPKCQHLLSSPHDQAAKSCSCCRLPTC